MQCELIHAIIPCLLIVTEPNAAIPHVLTLGRQGVINFTNTALNTALMWEMGRTCLRMICYFASLHTYSYKIRPLNPVIRVKHRAVRRCSLRVPLRAPGKRKAPRRQAFDVAVRIRIQLANLGRDGDLNILPDIAISMPAGGARTSAHAVGPGRRSSVGVRVTPSLDVLHLDLIDHALLAFVEGDVGDRVC